jgi:hypothetical protein
VVPAGYRFVFDEVADYLHARSVAEHIGGKLGSWSEKLSRVHTLLGQTNTLALTLEILAERDKTALARRLAGVLSDALARAPSGSAGTAVPTVSQAIGWLAQEREQFAAFAVLGALPNIAPFQDAKLSPIGWALSDDEIVYALMSQPDLLAGFPSTAAFSVPLRRRPPFVNGHDVA